MWGTSWRTLGRRISLIFMVADLLLPAYQYILIATDGSPLSDKAVEAGLSLAALAGAAVVALKVIPHYPRSYFEGGLATDTNDMKRIEQQWSEAAHTLVNAIKNQGEAQKVSPQP